MQPTNTYSLLRIKLTNSLVAEVGIPKRSTGKGVIIAQGLPSSPDKRRLLSFLAERGYISIHPRYEGSWESAGFFADHSPAQDIQNVIRVVSKKKSVTDLWTGETFSFHLTSLILIGISFGGPGVLLNSKNKFVKKVIAVSPVLDWSVEGEDEPFEKWIQLLEHGYPGAYRVRSKKNWLHFQEKDFYNPVTMTQDIDGSKIFILHAQDDHVVPVEPVVPFAEKTGAQYYLKPHGGHRLDIRHQFLWKKIEKFLRQK